MTVARGFVMETSLSMYPTRSFTWARGNLILHSSLHSEGTSSRTESSEAHIVLVPDFKGISATEDDIVLAKVLLRYRKRWYHGLGERKWFCFK